MESQYTHYYLDGFFSVMTDYMGLREAHGRKRLYENVPIYIGESHTITGELNKSTQNEIAGIFTSGWCIHHVRHDLLEKFMADINIEKQTKDTVSANIKRLGDYDIPAMRNELNTPEENLVAQSGAALSQGFNGHLAMDFGYFLENGISGVLQDIDKYAQNSKRKEFYEALRVTAEGMGRYIERHGEHALQCRGREGYDEARLDAIAGACANIRKNPAGSFYEAVQYQWFLMTLSDYDSYGRYDQYMYPFYRRDIESGHITRDRAKEYIMDMVRRADECGGILNMTIGGLTPDGESAVNDLTYLIMEAVRELGFKAPNLCLRISAQSDERLWQSVAESLSAGQALPAIYNDDVFVPMMVKSGVSQRDANNYSLAGCSQAVVPYKSNFNCDVGLYTPAKMLDLCLHNGYDTRLGKQVGPQTGDPATFEDFGQLMDAYAKQMRYCVEKGVALNDHDMVTRKQVLSSVRTLLMPECIEVGLGVCEGGCTYHGIQGEVIGLTNTADALMAVKEWVFDKGRLTMAEVIAAIDSDFFGYEDIRAKLLSSPKFGNGIDEVDELRGRITKDIYDEIASYKTELGGTHWPGEVIFVYHMGQGSQVGALPDGRRAWAPLADSAGPAQGNDISGITSMLCSCAKLPHRDTYFASINVNMKFPKKLWAEHREKIISAFKVYFEMGGSQLQVNVINKDALLDAMEHPDDHRNLVVRVGGFSAYFTHLSKDQQLEIISRTESDI